MTTEEALWLASLKKKGFSGLLLKATDDLYQPKKGGPIYDVRLGTEHANSAQTKKPRGQQPGQQPDQESKRPTAGRMMDISASWRPEALGGVTCQQRPGRHIQTQSHLGAASRHPHGPDALHIPRESAKSLAASLRAPGTMATIALPNIGTDYVRSQQFS